jgi:putative transposase
MVIPQEPDQRWSLDFVSDVFAHGRRFRILAVVDDFTAECLSLVADTSLSGARVARELDAAIAVRRKHCDRQRRWHGADQYGDLALVAGASGRMALHRAGKPQQNAFTESFNADCAMNCSMRPCSPRSPMPVPCWRTERTTIIAQDPTQGSDG